MTDFSNERYRLFRHNGDGSFRDVTNATGVGGVTLPFSGWSTRFFDFDNDGWKDIFVAQGHVMDTIEKTASNLRYLQPPLLLRNESGRFVRVDAGPPFRGEWAGRGAASGDLDNDGDVDSDREQRRAEGDAAPQRRRQRQELARDSRIGTRSNRDGIGARIKVVSASGVTQYFTVTTAAGYLSASDKRLLVGLNEDATAKLVEIRWPSGTVQTFENVKARTVLVATEPSSAGQAGPRDDHAPHAARSTRLLHFPGVRAGHLHAEREAAAARQTVGSAFQRTIH